MVWDIAHTSPNPQLLQLLSSEQKALCCLCSCYLVCVIVCLDVDVVVAALYEKLYKTFYLVRAALNNYEASKAPVARDRSTY